MENYGTYISRVLMMFSTRVVYLSIIQGIVTHINLSGKVLVNILL